MKLSAAIMSIAVALTLDAKRPGPSFVMVARTALAVSRRDGLAAAIGMGVGGVVFFFAAFTRLLALCFVVPLLPVALKVLGDSCLAFPGYRIWCNQGLPQ